MDLEDLQLSLNIIACFVGCILGLLITMFLVIVPDIKSIKSKDR